MLVIRYVCKVYMPLVRPGICITAVAHTPNGALICAMRGVVALKHNGTPKIPSHKRKGIEFEIEKTSHVHGHGAFSKAPLEPIRDLSYIYTLC